MWLVPPKLNGIVMNGIYKLKELESLSQLPTAPGSSASILFRLQVLLPCAPSPPCSCSWAPSFISFVSWTHGGPSAVGNTESPAACTSDRLPRPLSASQSFLSFLPPFSRRRVGVGVGEPQGAFKP